jgi:hypothetical protein
MQRPIPNPSAVTAEAAVAQQRRKRDQRGQIRLVFLRGDERKAPIRGSIARFVFMAKGITNIVERTVKRAL